MSTHTLHAKTLISFITAFSVVMSGVVLFGYSSRVEATPREKIKDSWGTSRSDKASSEALKKGRKYSQDTVLVTFKKERINLQSESNDSRIRDVGRGYDIKSRINKSTSVVYKLSEGEDVESAISILQENPLVEKVQPNYIYEPLAISTNDPDRQKLWGLDNTGQTVNGQAGTADADIDAPEAWGQLTGGESDVIVAVMDTGLDYNHPDLSGSLWDGSSCKDENGNAMGGCIHGYDFGFDDKDPKPEANDWYIDEDNNKVKENYNHGTHVAGTIAATHNNSEGIPGVSKNAKIMGLKVSTDAYYYDHITTANMIRALHFAAANGAKVINVSLGQYYYDTALEEAIIQCQLLVVAAAGNDGTNNDDSPVYPCSFDHASIICVAATDNQDKLAGYSNYGVTSVDIAAPGTNVYSTVDNFDYGNPTITDIYSQNFDGSTIPAEFTASTGATWDIENNMLVTNTATPYENNKNQSLTYNNTFDTSDAETIAVSFYAKCDTEYDTTAWTDYMRIDFSWDGGNSWLSKYNFEFEDNDYRYTLDFDEPQLDYENGDIDLNPNDNPGGYAEYQYTEKQNPYSGFSTDQLTFRFVWITDASDQGTAGGGCAIDNFVLHKVDFPVTRTYEYKSGTSMAAPHVTGAVAHLWSVQGDLTGSEIKNILIESGDSPGSLSGKTAKGTRLNLEEAVMFVEAENNIAVTKYFTWYDQSASDKKAWVLVGNPSTTETAYVQIQLGKEDKFYYSIPPNGRVVPRFGTIRTGPVTVTSDIEVYATQRVLYEGSFNEYEAIDSRDLTNSYKFTWYDSKDSSQKAWILVGNPSTTETANVTIKITDQINETYSIPPGDRITPRYNGIVAGPVEVTSDINVFASQRTIFKGSFNEYAGIPMNSLTNKYFFTWYDSKDSSQKAWILVGNPSTTETANVTIKISDQINETYSIPPGGRITPRYNGIVAGPVEVTSDINVFTSQRALFDGSFNEYPGIQIK
ncbi:MAG: S8 family serine peptidase [Candidatus Dojkabacteria bacterium]